nr:uncharacterized mitochondrial protein AtMg00810-like [Tanacetum cinerariifolium]
MENNKVISPGMLRIDPRKTFREDKFVPINKVRASIRTNPITASQPHVITKKVVNSDSNGFSSIGVDITTKTRRPQPRSNTKNDRGFGDLQWGNILITLVYFVEGLEHNLFSVGQFCDSNLEVIFRRNTCFIKKIEVVDLLKGNRTTNLYTINLHEMASASPICLMAHATSTKSWLWHQRLSHLNVDTINDLARNDLVTGLPKFKYHREHLCPSCEQGKCKRASHPPKPVPNSKQSLHLLHMDLCGLMRIASINEKRALCYPKNDHEDIKKLGAKGDIGFFIGYSANFCAYRVYNRRTKKIIETMNAKPTKKHLKEVKRIFRYLRGTVNMGLWYMKDSGFELTGFLDADYAGCKDTFKSISDGAQFLGEKLVSWFLKKQDCTMLSTLEAEYVSLSACCAQANWMRTQLTDYGYHFNKIPIYYEVEYIMFDNFETSYLTRSNSDFSVLYIYEFVENKCDDVTCKLRRRQPANLLKVPFESVTSDAITKILTPLFEPSDAVTMDCDAVSSHCMLF